MAGVPRKRRIEPPGRRFAEKYHKTGENAFRRRSIVPSHKSPHCSATFRALSRRPHRACAEIGGSTEMALVMPGVGIFFSNLHLTHILNELIIIDTMKISYIINNKITKKLVLCARTLQGTG